MIPETTEILIGSLRDLTLETDDMILTQIGMFQALQKYMLNVQQHEKFWKKNSWKPYEILEKALR